MSLTVGEHIGIIGECLADRVDFYKEWYSDHTYSETVFEGGKDIYNTAASALKPHAVNLISQNRTLFEDYVNPVLLSDAVQSTAGSFGGSALLVSGMIVGLPDFAADIINGRVGLRDMYDGAVQSFRNANQLIRDYSNGNTPTDPYERGRVAATTLGLPILILAGLIKSGSGFIDIGKGTAGTLANSFGSMITNEGLVLQTAMAVSVDLSIPVKNIASGVMYMSGTDGNKPTPSDGPFTSSQLRSEIKSAMLNESVVPKAWKPLVESSMNELTTYLNKQAALVANYSGSLPEIKPFIRQNIKMWIKEKDTIFTHGRYAQKMKDGVISPGHGAVGKIPHSLSRFKFFDRTKYEKVSMFNRFRRIESEGMWPGAKVKFANGLHASDKTFTIKSVTRFCEVVFEGEKGAKNPLHYKLAK
jgi:hypothetical protein